MFVLQAKLHVQILDKLHFLDLVILVYGLVSQTCYGYVLLAKKLPDQITDQFVWRRLFSQKHAALLLTIPMLQLPGYLVRRLLAKEE
jgi:hypothetical protein